MNLTEVTVDLTTALTEVFQPGVMIEVAVADMPSVEVGIPGPNGPPGPEGPEGPTGVVKVNHNADPNVARPDATLVYWVGTVQPLNAHPDDLLLLKET